MKRNVLRILGPIFGLAIFGLALWVIHDALKKYHYHDVLRALHNISPDRIGAAALLTVLGYLVLTGYDTLAFRYLKLSLGYGRIALVSFIGYAFSNNAGFNLFTAAPVRYRLYSAWGLSAVEITNVVAFCTTTFWIGVLTVGGASFVVEPPGLPASYHLPFTSARPLGFILLAFLAAYFVLTFLRKEPLRWRGWEFPLPTPGMALAQVVISSLDWALAGGVLFVLLPPDASLTYPRFLGIFLLAQLGGLVSQIPGGLGVFESTVLLLLPGSYSTASVLGALLAYRAIYYIGPLLVAAVAMGASELVESRHLVKKAASALGQWYSALAPHFLALITFIGGAILLFSGAMPVGRADLNLIRDLLPLPVLEVSHFLGSLVGAGLLLLARGIQRRIDAAYILTLGLLGGGVILSILKGLDYRPAMVLGVIFIVLLPCRPLFYRRASLFSQRFSAGWITAIVLVLLCSVWLGFFAYKHVEYSNELWWRFSLSQGAPRFMRATVGTIGALLFFAAWRLLRPAAPEPVLPGAVEMDRVASVVEASPLTYAHLAMLGDKSFLFSDTGRAFLMYAVQGRSWVVMGDPVGADDDKVELCWTFRELCDRHGGWPVFYQVRPETLHIYLDMGLTLMKLGEEARVPLADFTMEGSSRKRLRYVYNHLGGDGYTFSVLPPEACAASIHTLRDVSDRWLEDKNTREKGFSLGFFDEAYISRYPAAIVSQGDRILAFANVLSSAGRSELSIDLMRYLPDAPNAIMDFLFINLMLWGRREGYRWFNLGMAPLAGLDNRSLAPLWNRLGALIFLHGEHFYNFQGLREYKDKFDPEWEPRYLASPGGIALPSILTNLATLISGGIKGIIAK